MDNTQKISPDEEHRAWRISFDARLADLHKSLDDLRDVAVKGFPDDDPLGHRKVHENYIKRAESRQKMYQDVATTTLKGVIWAVLLFVGVAVWNHFKSFL